MFAYRSLFGSAVILGMISTAAYADIPDATSAELELSTGRPKVDLMINDEGPFPFIFDTGAAVFTMHPTLVETLNLEITGQSEISSPGGQAFPVDVVSLDQVSLSGAEMGAVDALIVDIGMPVEVGGYGVVGPVQFQEYGRVAFDFESQLVEIGGTFDKPDNVAWQAFGDDAPLLDVMLRIGDTEIPAHIDTGNPGILMLPRSYAEQLPLDAEPSVVGQIRLVDGEMDIYGAPVSESFQAADATIPASTVLLFDRAIANIGTGALRGLQLEIDWDNQRYALWGEAQPVALQRQRRPQ